MKKEALLVYGNANPGENKRKFQEFVETNLTVMSRIAKLSGYNTKTVNVSQFDTDFKEYQDTDAFLFDYVGHSEGLFLGPFKLEKVVETVENLNGKKIIVLDSCTDSFIKNHNPKPGTLIAGCFDVTYQSPVSLSFYDSIIARGKSLESITPETFKEINHHWILCKEGKHA
jgi:hypothetical protein